LGGNRECLHVRSVYEILGRNRECLHVRSVYDSLTLSVSLKMREDSVREIVHDSINVPTA
jgi:hypothetical protein